MWKVAIVGPGGVGGLVGGVLARGGHDVRYVGRPPTAAALNATGLTVHSAQFGDFAVPAVAADRLSTPVELTVLATKATALPEALDDLAPPAAAGLTGLTGLVLPLLNGV